MNGFGEERIRVMVVQMMETGLRWWSCGAIEYPRSVMFHFKVHNGLLFGGGGGGEGEATVSTRIRTNEFKRIQTNSNFKIRPFVKTNYVMAEQRK